jgi:dsDNA-binding SOS-regulon protein
MKQFYSITVTNLFLIAVNKTPVFIKDKEHENIKFYLAESRNSVINFSVLLKRSRGQEFRFHFRATQSRNMTEYDWLGLGLGIG